jgi:UDP-glucose 4-epimerase
MARRSSVAPPSSAMVVGGAGFLGSHLVDRLVSEDVSVHVVDSMATGNLANLAAARRSGHDGRLTIQQLDAATPEFADYVARRRPAVVYLLAGLESWARGPMDAVLAFGTFVNVLEAIRAGSPDSKLVFALPGSLLYGDAPARELPLKEDHERRPIGVPGVVTQAMIDTADAYRNDHGVEYTALALSTVYGPRLRPESNVVGAALAARADGRDFSLHGDGRQTRDFLFVDDCVDALWRTATRGGGLLLNLGTGRQTAIRDLVASIAADGAVVEAPRRARSPLRVALSPSRARLHLGWSPWTTLDEGLARCLAES